MNIEGFILQSKEVFGDLYIYNKSIIVNLKTKVEIICRIHGSFFQSYPSHLAGHGCIKCAGNFKYNIEYFIQRANIVHYYKFNYCKSVYINIKTKIEIICPAHGSFFQTPHDHLSGYRCKKCKVIKLTSFNEFVEKAHAKHGVFTYINNNFKFSEKTEIVCSKHGSFFMKPNNHLNGQGCPKCTNHFSKPEIQWLDSLCIKKENRQISLPNLFNRIKVDGYDPETNTVYEFHGDFWHGNPNNAKYPPEAINKRNKLTFKELYDKTIARDDLIRNSGYNLVVMWEYDFKNMLKEMKNEIKRIS